MAGLQFPSLAASFAGQHVGALLNNNSYMMPNADNSQSPTLQQQPGTMQSTADYLAQLLKDRKQLTAFPNVFLHVERILDDGKWTVCVVCLNKCLHRAPALSLAIL